MRKYFTLAFIVFCGTIFAQSLTKTNLGSFTFSSYPNCQIPLGYKLYTVVDENQMVYPRGTIVNDRIYLPNRQKVRMTGSADIIITVYNVADRIIKIPGIIRHPSDTTKLKVKWMKIIQYDVDVTDSNGLLFHIQKDEHYPLESGWVKDVKTAEQNATLRANQHTLGGELVEANKFINTQLGTIPFNTVHPHLYAMKCQKGNGFDYDSLLQAVVTFKAAAKIIKTDEYEIDLFKEKMDPWVNLWQDEIALYDYKSKRISEKGLASLHYNLAIYYMFIKEYEQAMEEFSLCDKIHKGFDNASEMTTLMRAWRNQQRNYEKIMKGE